MSTAYSKLTVKSQTVIPQAIRQKLGVKPGDRLRFRVTEHGVVVDKAPASESDDPFATFTEWSSKADDEAYADL